MKNTITVTVGIPAYNEGANIARLLVSLMEQKLGAHTLKEIIVVSDGSTDKTSEIVKSFKGNKIKLINNRMRRGQSYCQEVIFRKSKGEIILLLNADVLPGDKSLIRKVCDTFINRKINGILSGKPVPLPAINFIESVINESVKLKTQVFEQLKDGHNLFLCHGRIRAFSREFAMKLQWKNILNEDAYSYLMCVKSGYDFVYDPKVKVYYRSPTTLADHIRQSQRFLVSKEEMKKEFDTAFLDREYSIPAPLIVKNGLLYFAHHPLCVLVYAIISMYSFIVRKLHPTYRITFDQSPSSKRLDRI